MQLGLKSQFYFYTYPNTQVTSNSVSRKQARSTKHETFDGTNTFDRM